MYISFNFRISSCHPAYNKGKTTPVKQAGRKQDGVGDEQTGTQPVRWQSGDILLQFSPPGRGGRAGRAVKWADSGRNKKKLVFLCIGTDRSTGDSLGPLIGYKLKQERRRGTLVFGTLDRPVHAMNLEHYVQVLKNGYPDALVVAVDASVGDENHIGYVTLGRGSLKPGLGVCKELHAVGDLFITGIVAGCSHYDPMMLQSIRLALVMQLADCISAGIGLVENFCLDAASV